MSKEMAYIALCKCGSIVMACVDVPEHKKDTAKTVASCIKDGFEIKRVTVEAVKKSLDWCNNRGKCEQESKDA